MKSVVTRMSLTLAVSSLCALGAAGTAWAAVPGASGLAPTGHLGSQLQAPPPPPHRFRAKFNSLAQCQAQAKREHPNRPSDWDCRRGTDRNNPWEYWGA